MKRINYILLILVLVWGCDSPDVRFDKPQPEEGRNLNRFPRSFTGKYINISDSSILTISKRNIIQVWNQEGVVAKSELELELDTVVDGDLVLNLGNDNNFQLDIKLEKDSARIKFYRRDVKFSISEKNLLRKDQGYLFLNFKKEVDAWEVEYLKLSNGYLYFESLASSSDIDSLKKITTVVENMNDDSTIVSEYKIKPTKVELRKILDRKSPKKRFKKL